MIIKINLEDTIKEFEVDTMKELISQITEQLKDKDGNDLSEDDKQNASWMDAYLEKHKIKLEDNIVLKLYCTIKTDSLVSDTNLLGRIGNFIRGKREPWTEFILKPYIEVNNNLELNQARAASGITTINLAKRGRFYRW